MVRFLINCGSIKFLKQKSRGSIADVKCVSVGSRSVVGNYIASRIFVGQELVQKEKRSAKAWTMCLTDLGHCPDKLLECDAEQLLIWINWSIVCPRAEHWFKLT
ncbi:hypothetical protein BpHYR1_011972 [Brachionus plicatilis]|uniref:Uncharacterized protein n=1 Tax=Brachionus plicatilis TaxID=10195 RepID=A0A3M7RZL5_BRAPC|nr:hypothetical protein BpHYR1_011972 [Brachionus plicatilis]